MNGRIYLLLIAALFTVIAAISFFYYKRKSKGALIIFSALTALLLRVDYIIYTPHWVRQHDVVGFGNDFGQAGYIEWFYAHLRLPDFDPREKWGFFQPPLHHITAALFIHLETAAGIAYQKACENVQILTLIYSLLILFYAYRIFRQAGLLGWSLYFAFALAAMHPGFILLAGSINNDCLCELFMVMGLFYAIEWYRNSTMTAIIKVALCMGLSMMAKLSGILIAVSLGFIFIIKLIREKKPGFFKYLLQYMVFGVISIPLGVFYPVRNFIRFQVPLNFTPEVGESTESYSLVQRIFDIRTDTPFACMVNNGNAYDEYNIFLAMMKTSLFGETDLSADVAYVRPFAWIVFITGIMLAAAAFFATVYVCFHSLKDKKNVTETAFWGISYVTPVVFLINLSLTAQYFSSQDFRYIQYVIVVEALFTGLYFKNRGCEKTPDAMAKCYAVLLGIFCAAVFAVYVLLGKP